MIWKLKIIFHLFFFWDSLTVAMVGLELGMSTHLASNAQSAVIKGVSIKPGFIFNQENNIIYYSNKIERLLRNLLISFSLPWFLSNSFVQKMCILQGS